MESFLDSLNDDQLLSFLKRNYGHDEPIWIECSKEEYEAYAKKDILEQLLSEEQYKVEPIYKEWKGGILDLIKLLDTKKPDYYKYYKLVGYKKLILIGGKIADYLKKKRY